MSAYSEYLASTASAQAQMDFQERMSNTAHVREVADLKAAGLNPVLSAGGSGASTPSGAEGDYSAVLGVLAKSMSNSGKALNKMASGLSNALTSFAEQNKEEKSIEDIQKEVNSIIQAHNPFSSSWIDDDSTAMALFNTAKEVVTKGVSRSKLVNSIVTSMFDWATKGIDLLKENKEGKKYRKALPALYDKGYAPAVHSSYQNLQSQMLPKGYSNKKHYSINKYNEKRKKTLLGKIKSWFSYTPKNAKMAFKYR